MSKLFKLISDIFEIIEKPRMRQPCPTLPPPQGSYKHRQAACGYANGLA